MLPAADPQRLARGVGELVTRHVQRELQPLRERIERLETEQRVLLDLLAEQSEGKTDDAA